MTAGELAVLLAAVLCCFGFAALVVVLTRVLDTLRSLRAEIVTLRAETKPLLRDLNASTREARDALQEARHDLDRFEERFDVKLMRQTVGADGLATKLSVTGGVFDAQTTGRASFATRILGTDVVVDPNLPRSVFGGSLRLGAETQMTRASSIFGTVTGTIDGDRSRSVAVKGGFKLAF